MHVPGRVDHDEQGHDGHHGQHRGRSRIHGDSEEEAPSDVGPLEAIGEGLATGEAVAEDPERPHGGDGHGGDGQARAASGGPVAEADDDGEGHYWERRNDVGRLCEELEQG